MCVQYTLMLITNLLIMNWKYISGSLFLICSFNFYAFFVQVEESNAQEIYVHPLVSSQKLLSAFQ